VPSLHRSRSGIAAGASHRTGVLLGDQDPAPIVCVLVEIKVGPPENTHSHAETMPQVPLLAGGHPVARDTALVTAAVAAGRTAGPRADPASISRGPRPAPRHIACVPAPGQ